MLLPGSITTLIQLALASLALSQQINKPAAWPNLDQFGPALNTLPRTTYTISPWVNGYISQGCRDRVVLDGRDPTSFKSFTVSMGDCQMPWIVCREEGAQPPLEKLIDTFARVPIGMRQFVGDIVHFQGGGGASAWNKPCIVHMSGTSALSVGVWVHEAFHCVDGANGMGLMNGDPSWRDAYNRDSHVADNYARSSHAENFAQYAGLVIYDRFTKKKLQVFPQYNQIVNQIRRMAAAADSPQGNKMFDYSGKKTCNTRWPHTPVVNPATGAVISRRAFISPRNTGIFVMSPPVGGENPPATNCTLKGGSF